MAERLKREFIELLERDKEFRYTVAGYLGLGDILKRLDRIEENIQKLWEEVKSLREGQEKLWKGQERIWRYVTREFSELRMALGVSFEIQAAAYVELLLDEMGYPGARVGKKYLVHDGEVIEINLFCEEPLVVGEATVVVRSRGEAEAEVGKLVKRIDLVRSKYRKEPMLKILSVARVAADVSDVLRREAEKHGIKLVLGEEIEENLQPTT